MSIYRVLFTWNTSNAQRFDCLRNRHVFISHLKCSESPAGSRRQCGSEFQVVGPTKGNARVPYMLRLTRGVELTVMSSGRSQMLMTVNFRDWHTVVDEVPWSSVLKTTIQSCCDRPRSYFGVHW